MVALCIGLAALALAIGIIVGPSVKRRVQRGGVLDALLRERFVVTLRSGDTFDGLLERADANTIELRDPQAIKGDGGRVAIDGTLYLPRGEVIYLQRPDAR